MSESWRVITIGRGRSGNQWVSLLFNAGTSVGKRGRGLPQYMYQGLLWFTYAYVVCLALQHYNHDHLHTCANICIDYDRPALSIPINLMGGWGSYMFFGLHSYLLSSCVVCVELEMTCVSGPEERRGEIIQN